MATQPDSVPLRDLSRRLLEGSRSAAHPGAVEMMERTCTTLCRHLSAMIGLDAFALLLTRSVNHARGAFPWLGGVMPGRDGTLAGLSFAVEGVGDDERLDGFCAVLSAFFELLIAFIGEGLTLHLIQSVWPDVALGGDIPGQDGST